MNGQFRDYTTYDVKIILVASSLRISLRGMISLPCLWWVTVHLKHTNLSLTLQPFLRQIPKTYLLCNLHTKFMGVTRSLIIIIFQKYIMFHLNIVNFKTSIPMKATFKPTSKQIQYEALLLSDEV